VARQGPLVTTTAAAARARAPRACWRRGRSRRAHDVEPKGARFVRDAAYARALLLAWGGAHCERWEDPEPRARHVAELVVDDHTADRRASLRIAPPPMKPTGRGLGGHAHGVDVAPAVDGRAPVGAGEHEDSPRRRPPGRAPASGDLTAVLALHAERRREGGAHGDAQQELDVTRHTPGLPARGVGCARPDPPRGGC
jgi:hypothetical protein